MTVDPSEFADFYAALHPGCEPFAWQVRLATAVLSTGRWPHGIDAPTGAGKTAIIDIHVFAVAVMASGGLRVPRRLSVVVDRRAIVDSHETYARAIRERLSDAKDGGILDRVHQALRSLMTAASRGRASGRDKSGPFRLAVLRGGVAPSRAWLDDPAECQVICATPDMWGSRILFRPFGATRMSAPRSAGLLAYDSVLVIDEAHIARQFLTTARSVSRLLSTGVEPLGVPKLQVVAMTATQEPESSDAIGVRMQDFGDNADILLAKRLMRHKPVTLVPLAAWPPRRSGIRSVAVEMARRAVELRRRHGGTVACVANTIATATEVAAQLKRLMRESSDADWDRRGVPNAPDPVVSLVGRMRPDDVNRLRNERPGLLTVDGDGTVAFLVATQTIEVGLDLDFTAMVTEMAPAQALIQRAGRVNRLGRRESGEIVIIVSDSERSLVNGAPPYKADELKDAFAWLHTVAEHSEGLTPLVGEMFDTPPARLRRPALLRVEPWDALNLANTSIGQFDQSDLELWLDDDLEQDLDVSIIVRNLGTPVEDFARATELLRATPPLRHEAFQARIGNVRQSFEVGLPGEPRSPIGAVLRGEGILPLIRKDGTGSAAGDRHNGGIRVGDTLVIGDAEDVFKGGVFDPDGHEPSTDVYESIEEFGSDGVVRSAGRRVRIGDDFEDVLLDQPRLMNALRAIIADDPEIDTRDKSLLRCIDEHLIRGKGQLPAARLLEVLLDSWKRGIAPLPEILLPTAAGDCGLPWLVVASTERVAADEEARQSWSSRGAVPLARHSLAVEKRCAEISAVVGVAAGAARAVEAAGRHHDDGKADPRCQRALRGGIEAAGAEPLAKSGMTSPTRIRQSWAAAQLGGWRHEQMSAASLASRLASGDDVARPHTDLDLLLRLVGTSHGRGRPTFDGMTADLVEDVACPEGVGEASTELYDVGVWDDLIERTHRRYGVWGCAYLEALVRAADGQISGEGS